MDYRYTGTTGTAAIPTIETWAGTTGSFVVYPACQRGVHDANYAHDFEAFEDQRGSAPLMFCRQCGLVNKLEYVA